MKIALLALCFCSLANAQAIISVVAQGAYKDGTHATETTAAFVSAFSAAGSTGEVVVPPGTYLIDNSGGPLSVTGFSGEFNLVTGSLVKFTDNAHEGLHFTSGAGARIIGLHSTYQTPATSNINVTEVVISGTQDTILEGAIIESASAVGLQIIDSIRPKVHDVLVLNSLRDGVQIANCSNAEIVNLTTENTGDDGLAFINSLNDSNNYTGGTATNIIVHNSKARGISAAGQSDVVVDGFLVDGTAASGIICLTDTAFGTRTPDRVRFNDGIIKNVGTIALQGSGNQFGIEFGDVASCSFSNIQVIGSSAATVAVRGVSGSAPTGQISLSNIRVVGAGTISGADGFNVAAKLLNINDCIAQNSPGYGFYFAGSGTLMADSLTAINVSQSNILHRALWFGGTGFSAVTNAKVIDTQTTPSGYIVGSTGGQTGVIDGIITHINGGSPLYSFPLSTFDVYNSYNR
jgi:hypothetical protein